MYTIENHMFGQLTLVVNWKLHALWHIDMFGFFFVFFLIYVLGHFCLTTLLCNTF